MTRPDSSTRPGPAAAGLGAPDIPRMRATIAELAGNTYRGRRVGTPGGRAAGTWLAEQLNQLSATATTETFLVRGVRDLYATPTLRWRDHDLVHRRDFVEHLASADLPDARSGTLTTEPEPGGWLLSADPASAAHTPVTGVLTPRGVDAEGWMPKMIAGPPPGHRADPRRSYGPARPHDR